jgi:hypothetical protein
MAEEKSAAKQSAPKSPAKSEDARSSDPDLKPSDAEAPGPITPEHESGSWEQTLEEQEARGKAREEQRKS